MSNQAITSPQPVSQSPLWKLPPELRICIYEYALFQSDWCMVTRQHGIPEPALLLACKTINSDAALVMWQNHVFELEFFTDDLEKFVNRMSPAQRNAIRTIAFDVRAMDMGQTMSRRVKATPPDASSLST